MEFLLHVISVFLECLQLPVGVAFPRLAGVFLVLVLLILHVSLVLVVVHNLLGFFALRSCSSLSRLILIIFIIFVSVGGFHVLVLAGDLLLQVDLRLNLFLGRYALQQPRLQTLTREDLPVLQSLVYLVVYLVRSAVQSRSVRAYQSPSLFLLPLPFPSQEVQVPVRDWLDEFRLWDLRFLGSVCFLTSLIVIYQ